MQKIRKFIISFIAIIVLLQFNAFAYDNVMYIWQRSWDEYLHNSVATISDETEYFTVLCGDLKFQDDKPVIGTININWLYLTETETSTTLAFRISTEAGKLLQKDNIAITVDAIYQTITKAINGAPANQVVGVQFDYDCPTSKLNTYASFLKLFKAKVPDLEISITALPTWLNDRQFTALIKETDYYVLQFHSFEVPKTREQAREIFSNKRSRDYTKKASLLKHPYYISLPTYGYEVAFDSNGEFIGLRAESANILWGDEIQHEVAVVSVDKILDFLAYIKKEKPAFFKGICWFRLPIKTDEFNWDIKTLIAVLNNRNPETSFNIELSRKEDGLVEVYLVNTGQQNYWKDVSFDIVWSKKEKPIYDVLGSYKDNLIFKDKTIHFSGPAPKVGEKTLVSWLRIDNNNTIKSGGVIYEDK